ncbi:MAG: DUF2306 domain-containing protein [Propionibacteriaceae bacterium]
MTSTTVQASGRGRGTGRRWSPWATVLLVGVVAFLVYVLPPYLSLDPARARLQPMPDVAWFYPVLVTHIFLGSVVLLTGCLQVWPWLRRQHPRVHRWSGRTYVFACLPAALCVIAIAPLGRMGPNQQVANTALGVLWLITTVAGYRAARQRRFGAHREWMVRSFALSLSIVMNRFWSVVTIAVFSPEVLTGGPIDEVAFAQAVGVGTWLSWVVNLLLAEWWLHRRPARRPRTVASPDPVVEGPSTGSGIVVGQA